MAELKNEGTIEKVKEIFIYNPFAGSKGKKKTQQDVNLVSGEVAYFDVTLANPFLFDVDIQSMSIR
jgi:hypothetical protein